MLYVDIPTKDETLALAAVRSDACVSIYLPTTPQTQHIDQARIQFGNLTKSALNQLSEAGVDKRRIWPLAEAFDDLAEDEDFWAHQAHSLCVFATPEQLTAYRVPNALSPMAQVSDRFHLTPLFRAVTFSNHALILALAENGVRLVEVFADDPPVELRIPDMPKDAASHVGKATINDRSHSRRIHGSEGQKVRLRQYARKVDEVLRPVLANRDAPLVLAAAEPLASIFRSVNSYPHLVEEGIDASPGEFTPTQLASRTRPILDRRYASKLESFRNLYEARAAEGRATSDVAQAARAATIGAVDSLLVDMNDTRPGFVGPAGEVSWSEADDARAYIVVDEIATRAMLAGARIIAVRASDLAEGQSLAAILRYPV